MPPCAHTLGAEPCTQGSLSRWHRGTTCVGMSPDTGTEKRAGAAFHVVNRQFLSRTPPSRSVASGRSHWPAIPEDCGYHVAVAVAMSFECVALWLFSRKFNKLYRPQANTFWSKVEALSCWCASKENERVSSPSRLGSRGLSLSALGWGLPRKLGLELETTYCQTNSQNELIGSQPTQGQEDLAPIHTSGPRPALSREEEVETPSSHPPPIGCSHDRRCHALQAGPQGADSEGGGPEPHKHSGLCPWCHAWPGTQ